MGKVKKKWHDKTRGVSKYSGLEFDKGCVWQTLTIKMIHDGMPEQQVIFSLHVTFDGQKVYDKQCSVFGKECKIETISVRKDARIEIKGQADVMNITHIMPPAKAVYVEVTAEADYK